MCSRYTLTAPRTQLALCFDAALEGADQIAPTYNIMPAQQVPVIVEGSGVCCVWLIQWGFRRAWSRVDTGRPATRPLCLFSGADHPSAA